MDRLSSASADGSSFICPLLNDSVVLFLRCKCGSPDRLLHTAHNYNGQISNLVIFCSCNDCHKPDCLPIPSHSVNILLVVKEGLISVNGTIAWSTSHHNPTENQFSHYHGFTPTGPHQFWQCSLDVHEKDYSSAWPLPMFAKDFEIHEHELFRLQVGTSWEEHLATSRVSLDSIFQTSLSQRAVQG